MADGGNAGRTYPWGDQEPDPERANFGGNVGSASPVGVYPAGDGAYGHSDLAGNVWEWMDDLWDRTEDRPPRAVKGTDSSRYRGICGGAWYIDPRDPRSAIRGRNGPGGRVDDLGFRVARTLD